MLNLDENLYRLWYENSQGTRFVPTLAPDSIIPEDFCYQHSEFASSLTHDVLRVSRSREVEACVHEHISPTGGWIEGVEGRRCEDCLGTQTRQSTEPWPDAWRAGSSTRIFQGSSGYPADLVLAMTRPTPMEQELAAWRAREPGYTPAVARQESVGEVTAISPAYAAETGGKVGDPMVMRGPGPRLYSLFEAVLIAARACEGCLNVLLWEYGCGDGYPYKSERHQKVGTSCLFCVPVDTVYEDQLKVAASA